MSFKSVLKAIGHDIKVDIEYILPYAETVGKAAISVYFPALGPMYNNTVAAVQLAEKTGVAANLTALQKAEAVLKIAGPLIKVGLTDAGKANDDAAVQKYIDSVVLILDTAPVPPTAP